MKEAYDDTPREQASIPEEKVYTKPGLEKERAAATVKGVNGQVIDVNAGGTWITF